MFEVTDGLTKDTGNHRSITGNVPYGHGRLTPDERTKEPVDGQIGKGKYYHEEGSDSPPPAIVGFLSADAWSGSTLIRTDDSFVKQFASNDSDLGLYINYDEDNFWKACDRDEKIVRMR